MSLHQDSRFLPVWMQGLCCDPSSHSPLSPSPSCPQLSPAARKGWLPGIPAPSQSQEAPCQRQTATHSRVHGNGGHRENSRAAPGEPEWEESWSHRSRASAGLSLPASLLSTHTRSCCDYKRLLWAPSQERRAATPTLPLSEGEDQGTGSWLVLSSTSPCPAPASPDRLVGTSPWWVKPTQEAWLPGPQQDPSLGLPADKMGSQHRPLCLP